MRNNEALLFLESEAVAERGAQAMIRSTSSASRRIGCCALLKSANGTSPSSKKATEFATPPAEPVLAHVLKYFDLEHVLVIHPTLASRGGFATIILLVNC